MTAIQKEAIFWFTLIILIIFILPFVSAGFLDFFSEIIDTTARATADVTTSIALSNSAPNVSEVSSNVNASFDPTEASIRNIEFSVIVNDTNGDADIANVTANFTFVSDRNIVRSNDTMCVSEETGTDTASVNFTCTIAMDFFDATGDWEIRVTANDTQGASDVNDTVGLFYNLLTAMELSQTTLTLATVASGGENVTNSTVDATHINITNTGNREGLNLSVNASDLGTTNAGASATDFIPAANFTFGNFSLDRGSEGRDECHDSTIADPVNQTTNLVNITQTSVNGIIDNSSSTSNATSSLYLCLRHVPAGIGAFTYDTTRGGPWSIIVDPEP